MRLHVNIFKKARKQVLKNYTYVNVFKFCFLMYFDSSKRSKLFFLKENSHVVRKHLFKGRLAPALR